MEIKSIVPTARFSADLANGQHIDLDVEFIATDEVADFIKPGEELRLSKVFRKLLVDAVVGWNLHNSDGTAIPCDKVNKERLLPMVLGLPVKPLEGEKYGEALVRQVINFAGDSGNFLKN
jgi:hypothetical protein